jgi:hypothetical protein
MSKTIVYIDFHTSETVLADSDDFILRAGDLIHVSGSDWECIQIRYRPALRTVEVFLAKKP